MRLVCAAIFWAFAVLYALALAVLAVGTFGWFGFAKDPLSGVYVVLLGMPWNLLVDLFPERSWPVLSILAPAINLLLIRSVCRLFRRSRDTARDPASR